MKDRIFKYSRFFFSFHGLVVNVVKVTGVQVNHSSIFVVQEMLQRSKLNKLQLVE